MLLPSISHQYVVEHAGRIQPSLPRHQPFPSHPQLDCLLSKSVTVVNQRTAFRKTGKRQIYGPSKLSKHEASLADPLDSVNNSLIAGELQLGLRPFTS